MEKGIQEIRQGFAKKYNELYDRRVRIKDAE